LYNYSIVNNCKSKKRDAKIMAKMPSTLNRLVAFLRPAAEKNIEAAAATITKIERDEALLKNPGK
jgi:hypothetical protein